MAFFNLLILIIGAIGMAIILAVGVLWVLWKIGDSCVPDEMQCAFFVGFMALVMIALVWFGTLL